MSLGNPDDIGLNGTSQKYLIHPFTTPSASTFLTAVQKSLKGDNIHVSIMGNADSRVKDIQLVDQAKPVVAIDPRHCAPQFTTLQEKSSYFTKARTFVDVKSGATCFEVQGQLLSSRMTLVSADQTPIVNYKGKTFSSQQLKYVRTGVETESEPILVISASYDSAEGSVVSVVFDNLLSGMQCKIGFVGNWRRREAYIWLDRGQKGTKEPVAKIYCPQGASRDNFHFDIAANMDTALIVIICAIMADNEKAASTAFAAMIS